MTDKSWLVYIVECADSTLYTGCTNDLQSRIAAHNNGQGAKYTRGRNPVKLKHFQKCESRSHALQMEHKIKQLTKKEKELLISGKAAAPSV